MPGYHLAPTDQIALLAVIDPDAYTADTYFSAYVSVVNFRRLMAIVTVGDLGSSATVDFQVMQATETGAAPASATTISGAATTQFTQAGTDSNKQAIINLDVTALNLDSGFDCAAIRMIVGTATSDAAAYLFGLDPIYGAASDNDVATVDEIVTL
jgi:hypothetical protein